MGKKSSMCVSGRPILGWNGLQGQMSKFFGPFINYRETKLCKIGPGLSVALLLGLKVSDTK